MIRRADTIVACSAKLLRRNDCGSSSVSRALTCAASVRRYGPAQPSPSLGHDISTQVAPHYALDNVRQEHKLLIFLHY